MTMTNKITLSSDGPGYHSLTVGPPAIPHPLGLRDKANEIGLPSLRDEILSAMRDTPGYKRYSILADQIKAAQVKVDQANRTFSRVKAAKRLLEDNLEEGLADKMRNITTELAAAEQEKLAAEADLAELLPLLPKHWPTAANSIIGVPVSIVLPQLDALRGKRKLARERVNQACAKVAEILQNAVTEHIAPLSAELAVLDMAIDRTERGWDTLAIELFKELMGTTPSAPPAGVMNIRNVFSHRPPNPPTPDPASETGTKVFVHRNA